MLVTESESSTSAGLKAVAARAGTSDCPGRMSPVRLAAGSVGAVMPGREGTMRSASMAAICCSWSSVMSPVCSKTHQQRWAAAFTACWPGFLLMQTAEAREEAGRDALSSNHQNFDRVMAAGRQHQRHAAQSSQGQCQQERGVCMHYARADLSCRGRCTAAGMALHVLPMCRAADCEMPVRLTTRSCTVLRDWPVCSVTDSGKVTSPRSHCPRRLLPCRWGFTTQA